MMPPKLVVKPLDNGGKLWYILGMNSVKVKNRNQKLLEYKQKYPKMTNAALGRVFKLSRERVRQILGEGQGK